MKNVTFVTLIVLPCSFGQFRLQPQGQKVVRRFAPADPAVPNSLKAGTAQRLTTRDGAVWRTLERGLVREYQGGLEYLHGLRYLPNDK